MLDHQTMSFEHYLNNEKGSPKYEFSTGQLHPLAEVDDVYFAVRMNLAFLLNEHFSKQDGEVHVGETKLYTEATDTCLYPDILVSCGAAQQHQLYKTQANVVVEVVNNANRGYKLGHKLPCYRRANIAEILIVNAETPGVEYLCREADHWRLWDIAADAELSLPKVGFKCAVAEIYQDVFE